MIENIPINEKNFSSEIIEEMNELPIVDYLKLPDEIEKVIERKPYTIKTKAKLIWDGKQYFVRIPSEISNEMKVNKENRIKFTLTKPLPDSNEKPILKIELEQ